MTQPDNDNPAVARQFTVSPALLEEVGQDPAILTRVSRKMLLLQLSRQHKKLMELDAPAGVRQAFIEQLAKIGDALPKTNLNQNVGTGFSVSINFSGKPGQSGAQVTQVVVTADPAGDPTPADENIVDATITDVPDLPQEQLPPPEATDLPVPEDAQPKRGWVMD